MKSLTRVLLGTVLLASFGVDAFAQAPLTTNQLLARVSVLEQEVARLTALCAPPSAIPPPMQTGTTGRQSLGEASAQAAKVKHEWSAVNTVPRFDPTAQPVAVSPAVEASHSDGTAKGEVYWRSRVAPLHAKILAERARLVPLNARIVDLTNEVNSLGPINARRGGVEAERQKLITEAQTLDGILTGDTQVLQAIEEEGRRAGALPGWFRP